MMVNFKPNLVKKKKYITIPADKQSLSHPSHAGEDFPCPSCSIWITEEELKQNHYICTHCSFHFSCNAWYRIGSIADEGSFREINPCLSTINLLDFPEYDLKLQTAHKKTGLAEAIITGWANVNGIPVGLGVMDAQFMMGSMGSVVGEKICRLVEEVMEQRAPLIIFCASGGARMQEGIISLMQMAKTSAAIGRLHEAGLLYISVLTHPTTGGVSASFASLGDIIIAEPGALIGFTGPRVVEQALGKKLPENFQRAEFHINHGMVDMVVVRSDLKSVLHRILLMHQGGTNAQKEI